MADKRFTHDCIDCRYLGSGPVAGKQHDFYVCYGRASSKSLGGSAIARYGDPAHEYFSIPVRMLNDCHAPEAGVLAFLIARKADLEAMYV